jgi:hypothetical protein
MELPYALVFLGLLGAYMVYSEWAGLDSRYLVGAALVLLVATAVADATGAVASANTLAEYVFFLLAGGVVLLLVDYLRNDRAPADSGGPVAPPVPPAETVDERQGTADQTLDRPEQ